MTGPSARRGFTLLEMLASLALIGLLLTGVWAGIHTAMRTASHGRAEADHLDRLRGAQQFLRRDLAQASPIPWRRDQKGRGVVFSGATHAVTFVAPLPGFLGRLGPQLQSLQLVRGEQGDLRLQIAFALLPPDGSPPQPFGKPQVLLEHVRGGRFLYRGRDPAGRDTGWREQWPRVSRLPALVRIRLQPARGDWPTLTARLRIDASAVNRAAIRASALRGSSP